jgi:hypothetical protein
VRGHRRVLQAERSWEHYAGEPTASDAREGEWTREELQKMDAKFVKRVEHAVAAGLEHPVPFPQRPSSPAVRQR